MANAVRCVQNCGGQETIGGGKVTLLLGKGVDDMCNRMMEDLGDCILYWLGRWWQKKEARNCVGKLLLDIGASLSYHLS